MSSTVVNTKTLIGSIEKIIAKSAEIGYSEELFKELKDDLKYVSDKMSLTEREALLFSLVMDESLDGGVRFSNLTTKLNCSSMQLLSFITELDSLEKRKLLKGDSRSKSEKENYLVPKNIILKVKNNETIEAKQNETMSEKEFFDEMSDIFYDIDNEREIIEAIELLMKEYAHLPFCAAVRDLGIPKLHYNEKLLFYTFCDEFVNENSEDLCERDYLNHFNKSNKRYMKKMLSENRCSLLTNKIIEGRNNDGIIDLNCLSLSKSVKENLFPNFYISTNDCKYKNLIPSTSFAKKDMFYSPIVEQDVNTLIQLLSKENFASIQSKLKERGFRQGFACLFYGSPGTGKTETVNQICRKTGRDVMVIDVSKIKSAWVGESEKNIKNAFDKYREYVERMETTPILLFNEADAVLGIRKEGAEKAVDKMENSIQNIILQEMEQLNGIMIATTNLTNNLDKAFERRFLYKIEFDRPNTEVKSKIWQSMMPNLSSDNAMALAKKYDFSGGEIENIIRKCEVESILYNTDITLEILEKLCNNEKIDRRQSSTSKIGFKATSKNSTF